MTAVDDPRRSSSQRRAQPRSIGLVRKWTPVPSSSSQPPGAAVPKTIATSGRTSGSSFRRSTGRAMWRRSPSARMIRPSRIGARRAAASAASAAGRAGRAEVTEVMARRIVIGRLTRYAKTLSSESSVGATSNRVTPASRATRATIRANAGELGDPDRQAVVAQLGAEDAGSAMNAAASRRSSRRAHRERVRPIGHQPADLAEVAGGGEPAGDDRRGRGRRAARPPRGCASEKRIVRPRRPSAGAGPSCAAAGAGPCR